MLVLQRRVDQGIVIGDDIRIVVLGVSGETVRIGIDAPRDIPVLRSELVAGVEAENRRAATTTLHPPSPASLDAVTTLLRPSRTGDASR